MRGIRDQRGIGWPMRNGGATTDLVQVCTDATPRDVCSAPDSHTRLPDTKRNKDDPPYENLANAVSCSMRMNEIESDESGEVGFR